jgi:starch synthase
VHNLAFQGVFPAHLTEQLGLPPGSFQPEGVEYHGHLSFLKAGLHYAQHITTVSPSYAVEIQGEAMGFGMQGLLHARRHHLTGIINGIDDDEWNPWIDKRIAERFDAATIERKIFNKRALQARLGLDEREDIPLYAMVGRFAHQKGVDLIMQIAPQLVELPAQVALLGTGETELQREALALIARYPGKIAGVIGFDEDLSHLFEAGADVFLMPSRFEPCGLNQMYSQRYGTPPIVNPTGGLIDTVTDCTDANLANGSATGFVVEGPLHADSLLNACRRATTVWHDKKAWRALQKNGMTRDFSWAHSAAAYLEIYARLARGHHA